MRYFKGFVFTVDAIFSLIVASAAVAILLYTYYLPPTSFQGPAIEAASVLQALSQTTVAQAAQGVGMVAYAYQGYISGQYTWPQYGQNSSLTFSTSGYAPPGPDLLYQFLATNTIFPSPVTSGGLVVFTTKSTLYGLNASTGAVVFNSTVGGPFSTAPILFNNYIYTANTLGWVNAFPVSNVTVPAWSTNVGNVIQSPHTMLQQDAGLIQAGANFYWASNGTLAMGYPAANFHGALRTGALITAGGGTATTPANIILYPFQPGVIGLPRIWTYNTLGNSNGMQPPVSTGASFIVASYGFNTIVLTLNGALVWGRALDSQVQSAAATAGQNLYVETSGYVYGFTFGASQIFGTHTVANDANITPAVAQNLLYTLVNGNYIEGFSPSTGKLIWNISLPTIGTVSNAIGDIALSYGNAYAAAGNTLYAFGTCKANPGASLLEATAYMYLNNEGGCANLILNQTYPGQKYGMFINGVYAPSLSLASFNGKNSYVQVQNSNSLNPNNITVSFWAYVPQIVSNWRAVQKWQPNNQYAITFETGNIVAADVGASSNFEADANYSPYINKWAMLTYTYNGVSLTLYINGAAANSIPASGGALKASGEPLYISGPSGSDPYSGLLAGVQIYGSALTPSQVKGLYEAGISAGPVPGKGIAGWWPLEGSANDYSGVYNTGFPSNITYTERQYTPPSLQAAYQVSSASAPLSINTSGLYKPYNVSIVIWR